jgi:6-phosphogluconolactonase
MSLHLVSIIKLDLQYKQAIFYVLDYWGKMQKSNVSMTFAITSTLKQGIFMSNRFYIASKTATAEGGIYTYEKEPNTVAKQIAFTQLKNCNYVNFSPDQNYLYATCFIDQNAGVASYEIMTDGSLRLISQMKTGGMGACYVCTNPTGNFLYCANYVSGDFTEFKLENGKIIEKTQLVKHTGSGPNVKRQTSPHAHFADMTPDGKFLIVIDLGIDKVFTYPVDPVNGVDAEKPNILNVPAGAGPRHIIFPKSGAIAFLINELNNTVSSLSYDDGNFTIIETASTLLDNACGTIDSAALRFSEDEHYLFASNRGGNHDNIAIFKLNGMGRMTRKNIIASAGIHPRDINFLPGYDCFAATNTFSDQIVLFDFANETLTPNGMTIDIPAPLLIKW